MHELREMLLKELDKIQRKRELSAGSLDIVDKLTHSIKSIDTIMAMEDAGYSNDYSYGRGRYAKRDNMGRYSNDMAYDDRYMRNNMMSRNRGYSRDNQELIEELKDLEMNAQDEETRRMIKKFIKQAEM